MPWVAFYANFIWVMVLGLIGPSIPAIVQDLGISYSRAGFLFTALSMGSLFGTLFGGLVSDRINRRFLFSFCAFTLGLGLILFGRSLGYSSLIVFMFFMSLGGSPVGVIGQTIMLDMFPEKRSRYIPLQTFFAALGNLMAPLLVALNVIAGLTWRWSFFETSFLSFALLSLALTARYPVTGGDIKNRIPVKQIFSDKKVITASIFTLLSVSVDIGFSYWLAEYFAGSLGLPLKTASASVSIYLAGIITARLSTPLFLRYAGPLRILQISLSFSLVILLFYLFVPVIPVKMALVYFYGLGVGPFFPLMITLGTEDYSGQSGSVSGIIFSFMSVGGMIFPFLFGTIAQHSSIRTTYIVLAFLFVMILIALSLWKKRLHHLEEA
ncbi:MAG: MFS transporter [Spirochaetales bacterium]|nr:MFS transporter [Spirochaetales bacterium]